MENTTLQFPPSNKTKAKAFKKKIDKNNYLDYNLSRTKIKKDFVDITNTVDFILNYCYDNKYLDLNILNKRLVVCFIVLILSWTNILMFFSILRNPILIYNYKSYDNNSLTFSKISRKSLCICLENDTCVYSCYDDKETCKDYFNNLKGTITLTEIKNKYGFSYYIWFKAENFVNTIFYGSEKYCYVQQAINIISIFFFVGAILGDVMCSLFGDRFGKSKITFILLITNVLFNIIISSKNIFNGDDNGVFFNQTTALYSFYGFLIGFINFPVYYFVYTYILEIFPSNYGYYKLNSIINNFLIFSTALVLVFSYIKKFAIYYYVMCVLSLVISYFYKIYCLESPRYFSEYFMKQEKEDFFYKSIKKVLMKLNITKESRNWIIADEKDLLEKEYQHEQYQFKSIVFYNPYNEVIVSNEIMSKNYYNKEMKKLMINKNKDSEMQRKKSKKNREEVNITHLNNFGKKRIKKAKKKKETNKKSINILPNDIKDISNNNNKDKLKTQLTKDAKKSTMTRKLSASINKNEDNKDLKLFSKIDLRPKNKKSKGKDVFREYHIEEVESYDNIETLIKRKRNLTNNNRTFKELYLRMKSIGSALLLYVIIWIIFSYIYIGLQIRLIYDFLNPNSYIIDKQVGVIVYYFFMSLLVTYLTGKIAVYMSIKRIILVYLLITIICCIFPDLDNIWLNNDRKFYFSNKLTISDSSKNYLKATALVFSSSTMSFVILMTLSKPYSFLRGSFIGVCRAISHFANLISFLSVIINTTQTLIISFLGILCFIIFLTVNIGLSSEISFNEIIDSQSYKNTKEKKYKNVK